MPKISQTTKMQIKGKKVGSWSLPAGTSCPGSKNEDGSIVEVCKSCYAKKGMYRFPVVKAVREYNLQDYHKDDWVDRMIEEVSKYDYFRWFDSGDIETPELAKKIQRVVSHTQSTKHWIPTRSDKVLAIRHVLNNEYNYKGQVFVVPLTEVHNVALRLSADHIGLNNKERPGVNSYVIRPQDMFEAKRQGIFLCPVTAPGSTQKSCDWCTKCYTNAKVAYVLH